MTNPLQHQSFQAFPKINAPFVQANRQIDQAWLQFLINMWRKIFQIAGNSSTPGLPSSINITGPSPFAYQSAGFGMVLISGGGVVRSRFTRDAITFYDCGQHYAPVLLNLGDTLVIDFVDAGPTLTFVPMPFFIPGPIT